MLLSGMKVLSERAILHGNVPTPPERRRDEARIRQAGRAILALPEPFLEIYGGIGKHLLEEAERLKSELSAAGNSVGRPLEMGKLNFLFDCAHFLSEFGQIRQGVLNLDGEDPIYSTHSECPPPRVAIAFAQAIWESEGLGSTSAKNWEELVRKNWHRLFQDRVIDPPPDDYPESPEIRGWK
jgi:hypothetical protein